MKKLTLLTFLCALLIVPFAYGQTSLSSGEPSTIIEHGPMGSATRAAQDIGPLMYMPPVVITNNFGTTANGTDIACASGTTVRDNLVYSEYDLVGNFGITADFDVTDVEFGIGLNAPDGTAGATPIILNVYSNTGVFPGGTITLQGTAGYVVTPADAGTIVSVPLSATIPLGENLLFEIIVPDQDPANNLFRFSCNTDGAFAESLIASVICGIVAPVPMSAIGFGGNNFIMAALGNEAGGGGPVAGCGNAPEDIPAGAPGTTSGLMNDSVVAVADSGLIGTDYSLDNVTINAEHTFSSDLEIVLVSPAGTRVALSTDNGSSDGLDVAADLVFTDASANDIGGWNGGPPAADYRAEGGGDVFPVTFGDGPGVDMNTVFDGEDIMGNWTLQINDDAGGDFGIMNSFCINFASLAPQPIAECGNAPEDIPAGAPGTTSGLMNDSVAVVSDSGLIGTNYTLDNVEISAQHTFSSDLEIVLVSPTGTRVALSTDNGSLDGLDVAADLVFTDASANDIGGWNGGPPAADYRAEGGSDVFPVAFGDGPGVDMNTVFDGEDINGNWTLQINDDAGGDFGVMTNFCVNFEPIASLPPVINCPPDISVDNDAGMCTAVVNFADAVAIDPEDGPIAVTQITGPPSGSAFIVGDTLIEFEATDSTGNTVTCGFTITVNDTEDPVAVCQDITVEVDPVTGTVSINPADVDNGSSDNCGIDFMTLDIDTFDCSDVGPNVVTLTVTDIYGNSSQCNATVTVEDNTAPVIVCIGEPSTMTGTTSDSPALAIPDADPAGISTIMTVTDDFEMTDLDVHLDISHTWVGDLIVTIESPGGTSVTIVDQMGVPASTFGCSEDDLDVTLDDEASDPIEDECSGSPINGSFIPNNALSAFDGESTVGDWILTVSDNAGGDTGMINEWGITYSYDVSGSPLVVELDANGMATENVADLLMSVDEACGWTATVGGGGGAPGSITTLFATGNNGSPGGAVYFDITVGAEDLELTDLDTNTDDVGALTMDVYTLVGSYVGNEGDINAWTLQTSGSGTGAGVDNPSNIVLDSSITLTAGESYGMALVFTSASSHFYTNGDGSNENYDNGDLALALGAASNVPFDGSPFSPRVWNGALHYTVGSPPSTTIDFTCDDLGLNQIEITVTDDSGNTATCTATVEVLDVTAPVIVCADVTIELDEDGVVEIDPMDLIENMPGTYEVITISNDNGAGEGFTDFTVNVTDPDTVSFDWDYDTADGPLFDSFGYLLNGVYTELSDPNGGLQQSGNSGPINVAPGDVFGFRSYSLDGLFGACTTTISNFVPGFEGQFDPANWMLDLINSDGDAYFVEIPGGPLAFDACGITIWAVDVTEVTCDDIGTPIVITVFVSDASGNIAACQSTVTVVDLLGPEIVCPEDQTQDPGPGNLYWEVPDYWANGEATATDNCTDPVTVTSQDPAPGTLLPDGVYTVTMCAEDEYGNESCCTFELTIESILGIDDNELSNAIVMYPNPADNIVTIANSSSILLDTAMIYDVNGKLVSQIDLHDMQDEKVIDVSALASGVYMVQITGEQSTVVKRLIKE